MKIEVLGHEVEEDSVTENDDRVYVVEALSVDVEALAVDVEALAVVVE